MSGISFLGSHLSSGEKRKKCKKKKTRALPFSHQSLCESHFIAHSKSFATRPTVCQGLPPAVVWVCFLFLLCQEGTCKCYASVSSPDPPSSLVLYSSPPPLVLQLQALPLCPHLSIATLHPRQTVSLTLKPRPHSCRSLGAAPVLNLSGRCQLKCAYNPM